MTLPHAASLKAIRAFSILLAAWVFLATLASVSPAIHDWLHGGEEHTCSAHHGHCDGHSHHGEELEFAESHVCGVTLLASAIHTPETTSFFAFVGVLEVLDDAEIEFTIPASDRGNVQSRAPPILS